MAERSTQESATRTLSDKDFAVGAAERYFEDYVPGAVYEYGYAGVSEADIIRFAERFDPQPIHVERRVRRHRAVQRADRQWLAHGRHRHAHDR